MIIKDFRLHEEFPAKWRVTYLGAVRSEPSVGAKFFRVWLMQTNAEKFAFGKPIERDIEIGGVSKLEIGSVWDEKNTEIADPFRQNVWKRKEISIEPGILPEFIYDNNKKELSSYPFPYTESVRVIVTYDGDTKVIIPCPVVAKYFFFSSTKIVHSIFRGSHENLYQIIEMEDGGKRLKIAKGINKDLEIEHVVRLAYSKKYRNSALFIYNSLQKFSSRPHYEGSYANYGTNFPFDEPQIVDLFGIDFIWNGQKCFLATSIEGTDLPWPHDNIDIVPEVQNGKGKNAQNNDSVPYRNKSYGLNSADDLASADPSSYLSQTKIISVKNKRPISEIIPDRPIINLLDKLEQDNTYQGSTISMERDADGASTQEGKGGDTNLDQAELKVENSESQTNDIYDYIERFKSILDKIGNMEPNAAVTYRKLDSYDLSDGYYTVLPYKRIGEIATLAKSHNLNTDILNRFFYYSSKVVSTLKDKEIKGEKEKKEDTGPIPRRAIIANVSVSGHNFLMVEIDPVDYPLNTVMVYQANLAKIDDSKIDAVMLNAAKYAGRWKNLDDTGFFSREGLLSTRFDHEKEFNIVTNEVGDETIERIVIKDEEYVAKKILKAIKGIIFRLTNI